MILITASENPTADQEDDGDEETSQDEPEPIPFSALQALNTIDCYFRAQENSGSILSNVSKMQQEILATEAAKKKQTQITNFFAT